MKIKIISCSEEDHWYRDKIGEVFDVINSDINEYECTYRRGHLIQKGDCKVLSLLQTIEKVEMELAEMRVELNRRNEIDWLKDTCTYYCIDDEGVVYLCETAEDGTYDKFRFKTGNYYRTREIAEMKLKDMNDKITQKFAKIENYVRNNWDGWTADWNDNHQGKCSIYYNYMSKKWDFNVSVIFEGYNFYIGENMATHIVKMLNSGKL